MFIMFLAILSMQWTAWLSICFTFSMLVWLETSLKPYPIYNLSSCAERHEPQYYVMWSTGQWDDIFWIPLFNVIFIFLHWFTMTISSNIFWYFLHHNGWSDLSIFQKVYAKRNHGLTLQVFWSLIQMMNLLAHMEVEFISAFYFTCHIIYFKFD